MLSHEENARKVHAGADKFEPASRWGKVIGWVFHVPRNSTTEYSANGFSWVNLEGEVPDDIYGTRDDAVKVLRAYLRMKRQAPRERST